MRPPKGATLLVLALTATLAVDISRGAFREESPPVFLVENRAGVKVRLGEGFPVQGVHQFSDGTNIKAVIKMTTLAEVLSTGDVCSDPRPLENGESLDLIMENGKVLEMSRSWMPAAQRMSLGIPLHPDRMTELDWADLPGIGATTAARIEMDRQRNGEFHSLDGLVRVRGIGAKSIRKWAEFF